MIERGVWPACPEALSRRQAEGFINCAYELDGLEPPPPLRCRRINNWWSLQDAPKDWRTHAEQHWSRMSTEAKLAHLGGMLTQACAYCQQVINSFANVLDEAGPAESSTVLDPLVATFAAMETAGTGVLLRGLSQGPRHRTAVELLRQAQREAKERAAKKKEKEA